jgi:MFS family permease
MKSDIASHPGSDIRPGRLELTFIIQGISIVMIACAVLALIWKVLMLPFAVPKHTNYFNWAETSTPGASLDDVMVDPRPQEEQPLTEAAPTLDIEENDADGLVPFGLPGLLLRAIIICLPCIGGGYNLTVIGASLPSLAVTYGLDAALEGVVVSVYCGGCIIGAVLTSRLANDFGRKYILLLSALLLLVAQIIMTVSISLVFFLLGRSLVGVSCGLATSLAPMYIAELVPRVRRGFLVSVQEQASSMGLLFGFAAASLQNASFRHHAVVGMIFPLLALCLMPLVAESPRWLIGQQRFDEASQIMYKYIADREEAAQSLKACKGISKQNAHTELSAGTVFTSLVGCPEARRRLAMASAIMALEECIGIETSDAFCIQFLTEGGLKQAAVAMLLIGMVMAKAFVLLASGVFLDSCGRKPALYLSFGGMAFALLGSSWAFTSGKPYMLAIMWLLFNLMYAAGLGNVCPVLCSESFPDQRTRGVGIAFTYILNRLVGACVTGTFPVLHEEIGTSSIFLLWAAAAFGGLAFTYFCMVETRGRVLEDC